MCECFILDKLQVGVDIRFCLISITQMDFARFADVKIGYQRLHILPLDSQRQIVDSFTKKNLFFITYSRVTNTRRLRAYIREIADPISISSRSEADVAAKLLLKRKLTSSSLEDKEKNAVEPSAKRAKTARTANKQCSSIRKRSCAQTNYT
jgi:hypothetical protein